MMPRQGRPSGPPHLHVLFCWCGPSGTVGMSSGDDDRPHFLSLLLNCAVFSEQLHFCHCPVSGVPPHLLRLTPAPAFSGLHVAAQVPDGALVSAQVASQCQCNERISGSGRGSFCGARPMCSAPTDESFVFMRVCPLCNWRAIAIANCLHMATPSSEFCSG